MKIELFLTQQQISKRIKEIAEEIKNKHSDNKILLLGILKGSFVFMADLVRELSSKNMEIQIEFVEIKSYDGFSSTGIVKINKKLDFVKNKRVIIVEDIYDTGLTMEELYKEIMLNHPQKLEICVLLLKDINRKRNIKIDYIGFKIPNKFVVGYGLDYNEKFRELPYIGVITDDQ